MGVKISELTQAMAAQDTDVLPIVQNGETKKITKENLFNDTETEIENLEGSKVNKTGDTLTGELNFNNKNDYAAIRKTRTINDTDYSVSVGVGVNSSARMELYQGNNTLGSVEARTDGIYNGLSGKKLAEQSTGWTNATLTSKIKGTIRYTKLGNIVIVNFSDVEANGSIAGNADILATGLPNSSVYLVSSLPNYGTPSKPIRIGITTDGKIQTHYSNNFTASESTGFYGTIVYITN